MAELNTLARPYARAAFEYACGKDALTEWSLQLATVAAITANSQVKIALASPSLTSEEKAKLVVELAGDALNEAQQRYISVLADNHRLPLLPDIAVQFERLKTEHEKLVDVSISTPFELDEAAVEKLKQSLSSKMARQINVVTSVDNSLLGGVLIRAGDTVIDGSVRGRLNRLAEAMN